MENNPVPIIGKTTPEESRWLMFGLAGLIRRRIWSRLDE
jgi:hypothetical protein